MPPANIRRWHIFMMLENNSNCSFENNLECTMTYMPSKERIPYLNSKDNYHLCIIGIAEHGFRIFAPGAAFTGCSGSAVMSFFRMQAHSPLSRIQIHINKFFSLFPHTCPVNAKIAPLRIIHQHKCHVHSRPF